jgi:hypothetical protein
MLAGMPHEPAGITATLAFAITRNFQFAFLTPEVYHQLPLLRFSFFCIRSRANEPDALGRPFLGPKSHDLPIPQRSLGHFSLQILRRPDWFRLRAVPVRLATANPPSAAACFPRRHAGVTSITARQTRFTHDQSSYTGRGIAMNTIAFEPDPNQTAEVHLGTRPLAVKEILAATDFPKRRLWRSKSPAGKAIRL